jgi:hypothetical protein
LICPVTIQILNQTEVITLYLYKLYDGESLFASQASKIAEIINVLPCADETIDLTAAATASAPLAENRCR